MHAIHPCTFAFLGSQLPTNWAKKIVNVAHLPLSRPVAVRVCAGIHGAVDAGGIGPGVGLEVTSQRKKAVELGVQRDHRDCCFQAGRVVNLD